MRPTKDEYFLAMAKLVASRSTCLRRAVGCVLVNARGHVLSTGYNGRAAGLPHCNDAKPWITHGVPSVHEPFVASDGSRICFPNACAGARATSGTELDACEAIHAEQNALLQCRDVYAIHTCYVTVSPCVTCVKLLMNTSCQRIAFLEEYTHAEPARELWWKHVPEYLPGGSYLTWDRVPAGAVTVGLP